MLGIIEHGKIHCVNVQKFQAELRRLFDDQSICTNATHPEAEIKPSENRWIRIGVPIPRSGKKRRNEKWKDVMREIAAVPFKGYDWRNFIHTTFPRFVAQEGEHNGRNIGKTILQALENCHEQRGE